MSQTMTPSPSAMPELPEPHFSADAIYTREQLDAYSERYGDWCARIALETFKADELLAYGNARERRAVEALRELVACKDLKERRDAKLREADHPSLVISSSALYPVAHKQPEHQNICREWNDLCAEYNRRQPLAWADAREILAGTAPLESDRKGREELGLSYEELSDELDRVQKAFDDLKATTGEHYICRDNPHICDLPNEHAGKCEKIEEQEPVAWRSRYRLLGGAWEPWEITEKPWVNTLGGMFELENVPLFLHPAKEGNDGP